jgi:hypothetical protein
MLTICGFRKKRENKNYSTNDFLRYENCVTTLKLLLPVTTLLLHQKRSTRHEKKEKEIYTIYFSR